MARAAEKGGVMAAVRPPICTPKGQTGFQMGTCKKLLPGIRPAMPRPSRASPGLPACLVRAAGARRGSGRSWTPGSGHGRLRTKTPLRKASRKPIISCEMLAFLSASDNINTVPCPLLTVEWNRVDTCRVPTVVTPCQLLSGSAICGRRPRRWRRYLP